MRPAELRPQCGRNWKGSVKLSEPFQLSHGKTSAEFRLQGFCEPAYQECTVIGTVFARLFFFENTPADLPVHFYTGVVHRPYSFCTALQNERADIGGKKVLCLHNGR